MNSKICVHLSQQVTERLEAAAKRPGATKSTIVEAALDRFLNPDGEATDRGMHLHPLEWINRQLEQLDRELRIVSETVALHAQFHLTVTPPLPTSQHHSACAVGRERFEIFAAQVGRRVQLGTSLMHQTICRLRAVSPDLFASVLVEDTSLGTQTTDCNPHAPASTAANENSKFSAAAREDGSNAGFCDNDRNSSH